MFTFLAFPVERPRFMSQFRYIDEKTARKELARCKRAKKDWRGCVNDYGPEDLKPYTLYRLVEDEAYLADRRKKNEAGCSLLGIIARKQKERLQKEIAKLSRMRAGAGMEGAAELECAISALKWAAGLQKKPESSLYGR